MSDRETHKHRVTQVCLRCGRPAPAKVADVEVNVDRLTALEAAADAAVGVKHYRQSELAGMVEIHLATWQAIVAALDKLAVLDAAKETT